MTEPEQLELDFSDDEFCPKLYPPVKIDNAIWDRAGSTLSDVLCPFCRRVVDIPFAYGFCSNECLRAYNKKWNVKTPICKTISRVLLMPVALVYHIGLGIFCMIALPILWIGIIVRGLFHTFL